MDSSSCAAAIPKTIRNSLGRPFDVCCARCRGRSLGRSKRKRSLRKSAMARRYRLYASASLEHGTNCESVKAWDTCGRITAQHLLHKLAAAVLIHWGRASLCVNAGRRPEHETRAFFCACSTSASERARSNCSSLKFSDAFCAAYMCCFSRDIISVARIHLRRR